MGRFKDGLAESLPLHCHYTEHKHCIHTARLQKTGFFWNFSQQRGKFSPVTNMSFIIYKEGKKSGDNKKGEN